MDIYIITHLKGSIRRENSFDELSNTTFCFLVDQLGRY
jgi:hypothetical protein